MRRWLCGIIALILITKTGFSQVEAYRNGRCFGLYEKGVQISDACYKLIEQFTGDAYIVQTWTDKFGLMSSNGYLFEDTACVRIEYSFKINRLFKAKSREDGFKLCSIDGKELGTTSFSEFKVEYGYVLFKEEGLWGMMSQKGEVIVKPEHKEIIEGLCPIHPCSSQRYLLNTGRSDDYRFELRDLEGNLHAQLYKTSPEINSKANRYVFKQNSRYVVIDKFGNIQRRIPLTSELVVDNDGFSYELTNSLLTVYGPINNVVGRISNVDGLLNAGRNYVIIRSGGETKLISSSCEEVYSSFGSIHTLDDNYLIVNEGNLSYVINNNGSAITKPSTYKVTAVFNKAGVFSAGLGGKQDLYSIKTGQKQSVHSFSAARQAYNNELVFYYGLRGPFDLYKNGKTKIKEDLPHAFNSSRQLAHAYTGSTYLNHPFHHILNYNDSIVLASFNAGYDKLFNYDYYLINLRNVHLMKHFDEVKTHGNYDWLGSNNAKDTIPPENELVVTENGKWGVIGTNGVFKLPIDYDSIVGLSNVHLSFTKRQMEVHYHDKLFHVYRDKKYEILSNYIYIKEDNLHKLYGDNGVDYTIEAPSSYKNLLSKDMYYKDKSSHHLILHELQEDKTIKYEITRAILRESEPCLYEFTHKNKLGVLNHKLEVIVKPKMSEIHLDNDHMLYMIKRGKVVTKVID